mgnify:CR=1 FL=1
MPQTIAAIVAEMFLAALKKGAELTENTTDDQLVTFAAWVLNLPAVRAWLDDLNAPQPLIDVPAELNIDPALIAQWLPLILQIIAAYRRLITSH